MNTAKVGRNDPCTCGSGRKFKQCCARKTAPAAKFGVWAVAAVVIAIAGVIVYAVTFERGAGPRQVWDPAHGHYHTVP